MKMDPFIEAEEAAGHSVKHCCDFFEVIHSAAVSTVPCRQAEPSLTGSP